MPRKRTTIYDLLRENARALKSKAANASDEAFQKAMEMGQTFTTTHQAKVLITGLMQGRMDAADFAAALAENDKLRYTVSDLCRLRLEAANIPEVERGDGRFDFIAGAKTFWNEMHVPVPSEMEAARDARNIAIGVMAGREGLPYNGPKKKTIKEAIQDARERAGQILGDAKDKLDEGIQKAAQFAVEKLTPLAGKEPFLTKEEAAEFLETEVGKAYQAAYTEAGAGQIEELVQDLGKELKPSGVAEETLLEPLELAPFYEQVEREQALFTDQDIQDMYEAEAASYDDLMADMYEAEERERYEGKERELYEGEAEVYEDDGFSESIYSIPPDNGLALAR